MQRCSQQKILKVLSVDWDYFVNVNSTQRALYFPDGGTENITGKLSDFIWASRYASSIKSKEMSKEKYKDRIRESILDFKVRKEYYQLRKLFKNLSMHTHVMVTDSHVGMYDFVGYLGDKYRDNNKIQFEIDNIDYHHDVFPYGKYEPDCGNWLRLLIQEGKTSEVTWIRNNDSHLEEDILCGIQHTTNFSHVVNKKYDAVFLCRSRIWSPPHLDTRFISLIELLEKQTTSILIQEESGVRINRMKKIKPQLKYEEELNYMIMDELYNSSITGNS